MEEINCYSIHGIQQLLLHFAKNTYRAKESDNVSQDVLKKCIELVSLDYSHVVVSNAGGELSASYPAQIIIMEYERMSRATCTNSNSGSATCNNANVCTNTASMGSGPSNSPEIRPQNTIYENVYDGTKLRDLFGKARNARCRARFPVPVIFFRGKHICRSATLSGGPEIYGRSGLDYLFSGEEQAQVEVEAHQEEPQQVTSSDWQLFDRVRSQDIRLLQTLNVGTIVDLMVENKKVKFGMNITSSEKVDKANRYSDFKIISLPYPGCEFFKEYRDNDYVAKDLIFDWSQGYVDATLVVPDDHIVNQLKIDWSSYKMWDLINLTQNYLRLLLRYLVEQNCGMLVHCISGWDRTPLFVSLLRLSLWADGCIHQSLSAYQILYFTIAYDWMLFGHNLEDRLSKGEDIFFFCFYVLKYLVGDEFSIHRKEKSSIKQQQQHGVQQTQPQPAVLRTDSDSQLEGVLFEAEGPVSSQGSNVSLHSSWSSISSKSQEIAPVFLSTDDTNGNAVPIPFLAACHVAYSSSSSSDVTSTTSRDGNSPAAAHESTANAQAQCRSVTSAGNNYAGGECLLHCHNMTDRERDCLQCNGNGSGGTVRLPASPVKTHTSPVAVPSRPSIRHRNESTCSLSVGSWQFITGTGSLRGSGCGSNSACSSQAGSRLADPQLNLYDAPNLANDTSSVLNEDECFIYSNGAQEPSTVPLRRERLRSVRELFYTCYCSTIGLKIKDGSEGGLGNLLGNFAEKVGIKSPQ